MNKEKKQRIGDMQRQTKETDVKIKLNLDGAGTANIDTGVGFLDHMLELFAVHGGFDLDVQCVGDIQVDAHHSVEDVGITLGRLINHLLGDKKGIERFADAAVPMDEALCRSVVDLSGRPYLSVKTAAGAELAGKSGDFDLELVEEFLRAVSTYGLFTLHVIIEDGKNGHHIAEAVFKSFARALKKAVRIVSDRIPSSKGVI
ncbi:MAG: imidazoleglycerol-phosphate dehydratase HisB [Clostridiales bacterium]|jgi:imidazoleglycerol-phosphate dehydratase|nr:imidazoleglycerol-phosphate dehydratase HisB [Clostridiales bacterium]